MKMLQLQFQITNSYGTTDDVGRKVNAAVEALEGEGVEIVDVRTDFVTVDVHNIAKEKKLI